MVPVPLGRAESWPFLCLFEHGVRNLCACERLRKIAAVFHLSFLLFSVVVVGCLLPTVRDVRAGEGKLLTQVMHVALDTLLP